MVFLWNLGDSETIQLSRTLLNILTDFKNVAIWLVLILSLFFQLLEENCKSLTAGKSCCYLSSVEKYYFELMQKTPKKKKKKKNQILNTLFWLRVQLIKKKAVIENLWHDNISGCYLKKMTTSIPRTLSSIRFLTKTHIFFISIHFQLTIKNMESDLFGLGFLSWR